MEIPDGSVWVCIWCGAEWPIVMWQGYVEHLATHQDLWDLQREMDLMYPPIEGAIG